MIKDRANRELAKLCNALAFSSDVQVKRRLQGRGSAVVSELDTRRYVLPEKPDIQAPRLYNIDVPAAPATLFTDRDGRPLLQPGDRRPAHARMNDSSDEDEQPDDQDDEHRLLRIQKEAVTAHDGSDSECDDHDKRAMQDAMDALSVLDGVGRSAPRAEVAKQSIRVEGCVLPNSLTNRAPTMITATSAEKAKRSVRVVRRSIPDACAHAVYTSHHEIGSEDYAEVKVSCNDENLVQQDGQQATEAPVAITVDGILLSMKDKECLQRLTCAVVQGPVEASEGAVKLAAVAQHSPEPNSMPYYPDTSGGDIRLRERKKGIIPDYPVPTEDAPALPAAPTEEATPTEGATAAVEATAEGNAMKRARSDTEDDVTELKSARASDDANEQLEESDGYVAATNAVEPDEAAANATEPDEAAADAVKRVEAAADIGTQAGTAADVVKPVETITGATRSVEASSATV